MNPGPVLILGTLLLTGFIAGKLVSRIGLPKVTGYILAGIVLNPQVSGVIPESFIGHSDLATNLTLAIITFSVGASLNLRELRKVWKTVGISALFEAEFANIFIVAGFVFLLPLMIPGMSDVAVPLALLLGALGSPTDPSATLAVTRQYNCRGPVSRAVMGVAALDDGIGMINYSLASSAALVILAHTSFSPSSILSPLLRIAVSLSVGCFFGWVFSILEKKKFAVSQAGILALLLGCLYTCFGLAELLNADSLLAVMSMGFIVVNAGEWCRRIPGKVASGLDQMVFILFFTISGIKLDFSVLASSWLIILSFVLLRAAGKLTGTSIGARITGAAATVKKYAGFCLIPQGGIVIGLALVIQARQEFSAFSDTLVSVILGTVVVHELAGPVLSKWALRRAGEIKTS